MEELSNLFIKAHIERWTNAWNNKDLKTVLSMFADNIQFSNPKIKIVLPELNSEKIDNKKDLERYWSTELEKFDTLHFATFDGKTKFLALEESEFNDDNLIYKALAFMNHK
jgi:ketosteroid isomerase-like protein